MCRELGIGFVAYSPLGRGFLAGRFRKDDDISSEGDFRKNHPRFQGENFKNNLKLLAKIDELSKSKDCTPAQISLAWVLAQDEHIVPIPGTKQLKYLEENAKSIEISLTEEELLQLSTAIPIGSAAGLRYPEQAMKSVNI